MRTILNKIKFDRHQRLLDQLLPDALAFSVCDESGQSVWSNNEFLRSQKFKGIEVDSACGLETAVYQRMPGGVAWTACGDGHRFWYLRIADEQYVTVGFVGVVLADSFRDAESLQPILDCMSDQVCREYLLIAELSNMAEELTERYEELNLVYDTEDQVAQYAEGQEALKNLVERCCEYMDVAYAVLLLKNKGVSIQAHSSKSKLIEPGYVYQQLRDIVYDWVCITGKYIVANTPDDFTRPGIHPDLPCRVVCCPVFESGDNVCGMITLVNHSDSRKFSNSDKNLLTVMSRKVTKILQTSYDPLTGLIRRNGFEVFLDRAMRNARHDKHSVLHFNIDQLHVVNDTLGHEAGDYVISKVADLMRTKVPDYRNLARVGGDEFKVLLENENIGRAEQLAAVMRETISNLNMVWEGQPIKATVSVGVYGVDRGTESVTAAMAGAQLACEVASDQGGNRVQVYHREDEDLNRRKTELGMVNQVRSALQDEQFELLSQRIEPLADDDNSVHFEVLLRMLDYDGQLLSPIVFIPAAERYHLMPFVDRWVIQNSIAALARVWKDGTGLDGVCAINLSGQSLGESSVLQTIIDAINEHRVPPHRICFEITETAAISNIEEAKVFMRELKKLGCQFSLDDFGAGLSSFGYLKDLPVDYLKIDGKFVRELTRDGVSESMVRAMNHVGKAMGLKTVAEYVQTDAIRERIKSIGLDFAQGFAIEKPRPLSEQLDELSDTRKVATK